MKKLILSLAVLFMSTVIIGQSSVSGTLVDNKSNDPLIGASVLLKGSSTGALSDVDGNFKIMDLANGSYTIVVSYVGYSDQSMDITVDGGNLNLGTIGMNAGGVGLESVVITGTMDIVQDRRTPVAVSTIGAREIQAKAGNVEFPELMKNTPSIYVANQSGGYGDSEVFTRGFDQTNTAFLLNGQPINGMEDGRMYWSNWSGMTDVATAVQVQRGLGSSKLAISSVGGTTNIIMKPTAQSQGGSVSYLRGNDNYNKATLMYNTGMSDKGFGMTFLLTHWQGDGWAEGTKGQGQNYFISAGYEPNDKHQFNFLLTGAPQWHDQNFTKRISDHYKSGEFNIKFNGNYGFLGDEYLTERRNYYHKPVANINWEFSINDNTSLSTVLYASWGRGGGSGGIGNFGNRPRTDDGYIDWDATVANNMATEAEPDYELGRGVYVLRNSVNNHQWFGVVTNLEKTLSESLTLSVGADLRRYTGSHFREVRDFMGASGYAQSGRDRFPDGYVVTEAFEANPWKAVNSFAKEAPAGERIAYNNDETITYSGIFGQLEYSTDKISTYVQGAVSNQGSTRFELFNETEENKTSEKVNELGYNLKTGLSYLIDDNHSVFFNTGFYQRQPFFDNQFLNFSNTVNPVTAPEDIFGLEFGYKYQGKDFAANFNVYRTSWQGRVTTSTIDEGEEVDGFLFPVGGFVNITGLNQLHQGIELDFVYSVNSAFRVKGYASIGNWKYDGVATKDLYEDNLDRTLVSSTPSLDIDGVKVGGAAQNSLGLGLDYKATDDLRIDIDYNYYSKLYSNLGADTEELELPSFGLLDLGLSYNFDLNNGQFLTLRANVYNLLGEEYISRAWSSDPATGTEDGDWNGVARSNRVSFGKTTTWNVSAKYNF